MRAADLADVVQERGEQEQVGAVDAAHQAAGEHHGLDEVPVHGVAVHGTALRARADGRPLGEPAVDDAGLVEALPDPDQPGAGGQQVGEQVAADLGPRLGERGCLPGEVGQRGRGDRQVGPGRDHRGAQGQQRVGGQRAARPEDHLAVVLVHAEAERVELRPTRADPQGAGALRLAGSADRAVQCVGDGAPGVGHRRHQLVGVGVPEQRRDGVVVLPGEPVPALPGHHVHGVPHVEQGLVGLVHRDVRAVGQPGRDEGAEDSHVAQAAVGFLEVGFEALRQLAVPGVPGLEALDQLRQPATGVRAPVVRDGRAGGGHHLGVPGDTLEVEQPHRCHQVARGDGAALVDGADRVVELHAGVPDGIPDPVGQSAQVVPAERAPVVQEHEVHVAERAGVAAGEAADGGERDAVGGLAVERLGPHLAEPVAGQVGDGVTSGVACAGSVEAPGPRQVQAAGRQVGLLDRHVHHRALSTFPNVSFRVTPVLGVGGSLCEVAPVHVRSRPHFWPLVALQGPASGPACRTPGQRCGGMPRGRRCHAAYPARSQT